jgi:hypothetical protein
VSIPNFDLILQELFKAAIEELQQVGTEWIVDDLFSDRTLNYRDAITQYVNGITVTDDIREREHGRRFLYAIPSFPMADVPFPQIGTYLAPEELSDFFIGDSIGIESTEIRNGAGTVTAIEHTHGCFGQATYWSDIIANTKEEVIWLSRICQRKLLTNLRNLEAQGAMDVRISLGDMKLEQEHYPAMVFARRLIFSCKLGITWTDRVPINGTYQTGINTALEA